MNLPFYGQLNRSQFRKIVEKSSRKKSDSIPDLQLSQFERRLDVVVYRLNLAPNIF